MKTILEIAGVAAFGALIAAGASAPAHAGSPMSDAFVANVRPNVVFLDESSRLALDKSPSRAIRSFAHTEAREQTMAANSLTAWTQTYTRSGEAVALGTTVVGAPVAIAADLATLPVAVAAGATNGATDIVTGRSVAIDAPLTVTPMPAYATGYATPNYTLGGQFLPAQRDDMARLQMLNGRSFDALYKSTQVDGLRQLATLYRDYSLNGDDPSLRAIATVELPKINARLRELGRL